MMDHEFRDGKVYVRRTVEERARITDRLKKIDGQVRGVQKMIDEGRYCLDEIQQANAVVAAMREVELLIISTQHLVGSISAKFLNDT
jgi:DNA-binding FrmR family transcriptional regulator